MLMFRITSSLWLLLLLYVSALESMKWNLFKNSKGPPQEGQVRLEGSLLSSEGRVEIYHDGQWGTVCDDSWEKAESEVVCRQLGFPGARSAETGAKYGQGSGPIWLDDLDCRGTESSLSSCNFKGWAITDCSHNEDAGVVCETGKDLSNASEYSLDHSLGLAEELGSLFDSGNGCDFSIVVSSPNEDQDGDGKVEVKEQTVCVHALVLSLHPQINITNKSSSLSMQVSQACRPHVTSFLRYLYTRQIDVTISSAQCLHQLAFDFGLKQLLEGVGRIFTLLLPEDSTFQSQVSMYEYSVRTQDLVLQENCLHYLSLNCEALIDSPAWSDLSSTFLEAFLSRSDLVVQDEAFLLQALETWILGRGGAVSLENQEALLSHVRFQMIPPEKLFDLTFTSDLYRRHETLYRAGMLRGFQFNALPLSTLMKHMDNQSEEFLSRIYTADPWSVTINSTNFRIPSTQYDYYNGYRHNAYNYNNDRRQSFVTPVHSSVIFKTKQIQWHANVLMSQSECSNQGIRCASLPAARLFPDRSLTEYQSTIRFNNKLLLTCGGNDVFHIQDFKNNLALITTNSSSLGFPNPCPDKYSFRFVVRPEYV